MEIDPHALTSSALGRSQQAMTKLFEQTIPELAMSGAARCGHSFLEVFPCFLAFDVFVLPFHHSQLCASLILSRKRLIVYLLSCRTLETNSHFCAETSRNKLKP